MPIAWKALPLVEKLDRVSRRIDEMQPFIGEALAEVRLAKQGHNLPQYVTQKLHSLEEELAYATTRLRNRVQSLRKAIPQDAIEREHRHPELTL